MAPRAKTGRPQLSFIFTPQGFVCDIACDPETGHPNVAPESAGFLDAFMEDRIGALLDLGFQEAAAWFSPSMRFLHRLASTFLRDTCQSPDIELLRERAPMEPLDSTIQELLLALPFTPGAEHVDESWLAHIWEDLAAVFRDQIAAFDGTVDQYVTTRTQDLRVPGILKSSDCGNPVGRNILPQGRGFHDVRVFFYPEYRQGIFTVFGKIIL